VLELKVPKQSLLLLAAKTYSLWRLRR